MMNQDISQVSSSKLLSPPIEPYFESYVLSSSQGIFDNNNQNIQYKKIVQDSQLNVDKIIEQNEFDVYTNITNNLDNNSPQQKSQSSTTRNQNQSYAKSFNAKRNSHQNFTNMYNQEYIQLKQIVDLQRFQGNIPIGPLLSSNPSHSRKQLSLSVIEGSVTEKNNQNLDKMRQNNIQQHKSQQLNSIKSSKSTKYNIMQNDTLNEIIQNTEITSNDLMTTKQNQQNQHQDNNEQQKTLLNNQSNINNKKSNQTNNNMIHLSQILNYQQQPQVNNIIQSQLSQQSQFKTPITPFKYFHKRIQSTSNIKSVASINGIGYQASIKQDSQNHIDNDDKQYINQQRRISQDTISNDYMDEINYNNENVMIIPNQANNQDLYNKQINYNKQIMNDKLNNMINNKGFQQQKSWNLSFGGDQLHLNQPLQSDRSTHHPHLPIKQNKQKQKPVAASSGDPFNQAFILNQSDVKKLHANYIKSSITNNNNLQYDQKGQQLLSYRQQQQQLNTNINFKQSEEQTNAEIDVTLQGGLIQQQLYEQDMFRHQTTLNLRKRNSQRGRMKSEDLSHLNLKKQQFQYQGSVNNNNDQINQHKTFFDDQKSQGIDNSKLPSTIDVLRQHQSQFYPQQQKRQSSAPKKYLKYSKHLYQINNKNSSTSNNTDRGGGNQIEDQQKSEDILNKHRPRKELKFSPQLTQKTDMLLNMQQQRDGSKSSRNQNQQQLQYKESLIEQQNSQIDLIRKQQMLENISIKPYSDQSQQQQQSSFDNSSMKKRQKTERTLQQKQHHHTKNTTSLPQINLKGVIPNSRNDSNQNTLQNSYKQSKYSSRRSNDVKIKLTSNSRQVEQDPTNLYSHQSEEQDQHDLTYNLNNHQNHYLNNQPKLNAKSMNNINSHRNNHNNNNNFNANNNNNYNDMEYSHLELSFGEGSPVRRQSSISSQGDRTYNNNNQHHNQDLKDVYQEVEKKRQGIHTSQKKKEASFDKQGDFDMPAQKLKFEFGVKSHRQYNQLSEPLTKESQVELSQLFAQNKGHIEENPIIQSSSTIKLNDNDNIQNHHNNNDLAETSSFSKYDQIAQTSMDLLQFDDDSTTAPNIQDLILHSQQQSLQQNELIYFNELMPQQQQERSSQHSQRRKLPITNKKLKSIFGIPKNKQSSSSITNMEQSSLNNAGTSINQSQQQYIVGQSTSISKFLQGVEQSKHQLHQNTSEENVGGIKRLDTPTFLHRYKQNINNNTNVNNTNVGSRGSLNSQDSSSRLSPGKKKDIMQQVNSNKALNNPRIFHSRNQSSSNIIGGSALVGGGGVCCGVGGTTNIQNQHMNGKNTLNSRIIFQSQYSHTQQTDQDIQQHSNNKQDIQRIKKDNIKLINGHQHQHRRNNTHHQAVAMNENFEEQNHNDLIKINQLIDQGRKQVQQQQQQQHQQQQPLLFNIKFIE